jgi:hypothetical protein
MDISHHSLRRLTRRLDATRDPMKRLALRRRIATMEQQLQGSHHEQIDHRGTQTRTYRNTAFTADQGCPSRS